jgi:hypothetical protein
VKRQEAEVLAQRSEKGRLQASADVAVSELDTLRAQIVAEEAKKQEVDTEVVAQEAQFARFDSLSLHHQVNIAATAIRRAEGSLALNRDRIRQNTGLPIETLQAIQSLASARAMYADSIIEYNFAQLRLHAALGRFSHASSLDRQK